MSENDPLESWDTDELTRNTHDSIDNINTDKKQKTKKKVSKKSKKDKERPETTFPELITTDKREEKTAQGAPDSDRETI